MSGAPSVEGPVARAKCARVKGEDVVETLSGGCVSDCGLGMLSVRQLAAMSCVPADAIALYTIARKPRARDCKAKGALQSCRAWSLPVHMFLVLFVHTTKPRQNHTTSGEASTTQAWALRSIYPPL